MAPHIYTNHTSEQVVVSDEPLAHLEGVARWEHTEGDAPKQTKPVEIPQGNPEEKWTVDQLRAYADRGNIDLGDAKVKAEILGVIERHKPGNPVDNGPSTEGKEQKFPEPGTPAPKE